MSAIDQIVTGFGWQIGDLERARAELAQLREKAAEYDSIADLIDPQRAYDKSIHDQIVDLLHDDTSKEYPEIDALRADLQAAQARIAEQARQLEEARNNLTVMTNYCEYWLTSGRNMNGTNDLFVLNASIESSRAWLAANPAPEPQP